MAATPRPGNEENGWGEYRRLVLSELERLNSDIANLEKRVSDVHVAIDKQIRDEMKAAEEATIRKNREIDKKFKSFDDEQKKHAADIVALKTKAIILGASAGFVVALAGLIVSIFLKK